ncbi:MAG: YggT family protein [Armatimonadota bacterium]
MLIRLFYIAINVYSFGLIAYVLLSWVNHPKAITARSWLEKFYKPVLDQVKRIVKPITVGSATLDLSPIILFFAVGFVGKLIMTFLIGMP